MSKDLNFDKNSITRKSIRQFDFDTVVKPTQILKDPLPGKSCPICRSGVFDYDGLLNLTCGNCGYTLSGCST